MRQPLRGQTAKYRHDHGRGGAGALLIAGRYRERLPRREGVGQSPTLTTPPPTDNHGIGSSSSAGRTRRALAKAKMLNRLATAADQSSFNPSWGQSFTYDGFGNLTNVNVTQGSAPTLTAGYDANNHGGGEDANGNPGTIELPAIGYPASAGYDVENRSVSLNTGFSGGPLYYYSYAPGNKRVWRGSWTYTYSMGAYTYTRGTDVITFWSVNGQKLADYQITAGAGPVQTGINYYFGAKLIKNNNGWVSSDRLGSNGKFYPYGHERPSATTNGTEKFTGYFRDAETGNDYADQRYMSPGMGRFMTPDRMTGSPADPGGWNKYAYTRGDPINRKDPVGNYDCTVGVGDYQETVDCEDYTVYEGPASPQCMLFAQAGRGGNPEAAVYYETYCAGGGTIQRQGAANGDITVPNFSNSGPMQGVITLDLQKLEGWLSQDSTCESWLTANLAGNGDSIYGLINSYISSNSYGYGNFYVNGSQNYTTAAFEGNLNADYTATGVPGSAAFTINPSGAFFTANAPGGGTLTVGAGNWMGGTLQAQAAILIHELAHLVQAAGFVPDTGGTPAQNAANVKANDAAVNKNCGNLINEFH